jgi:altronate dehydratase large subunit
MTSDDPTFLGYRRQDGQIGVRNHLLVLSVTGLTGPTAKRIGQAIRGAVVISAPYGSGLLGRDREAYQRALIGLGSHPNVGAALVIGADRPKAEQIAAAIEASGTKVAALVLDDHGHDALTLTDRGIRVGAGLAREISGRRREPAPLGTLCFGMECGRSDPSSGLVANPLIGCIADRMVEAGGRVILGETTEWLGAEHLLAGRAATPGVARQIIEAAARRERMAIEAGIDLTGNNPGHANIVAGLSSIEEKSLGAIAKSGRAPIQSVLAYAEAPSGPGLHLMDAPHYSPESLTGFTAAGAQMLLFSTGVGNSFGSALAPTLKISANPATCARLGQQLDFDASAAFLGEEALEEMARRLLGVVLETASGTATWAEVLIEGEEVISRHGEAL